MTSPGPERDGARVPVGDLVDLDALERDGRRVSPARLRAALPRGWVLEPDGLHARRDLRLFFRESWILLCGLAIFGGVAVALFWSVMPRGWAGLGRLVLAVGALLLAGGLAGPLITRALNRRASVERETKEGERSDRSPSP
ncbi:MAG: hypothetical protein QF903_02670 [Planctomycetota bacterium]|jgi:hypothetical protein|nr:hypothetical protein [Planctomycetota bacterium]MDP6761250.1 hypothetical protein [Planctomycetota bacterium]MDP6988365.1 hypothetical protein [Planctomycetota bacterium]